MGDREGAVAWSLVPQRVTRRLRAPHGEVRYLKVAPLGDKLSLADERHRLEWAASRLCAPRTRKEGVIVQEAGNIVFTLRHAYKKGGHHAR